MRIIDADALMERLKAWDTNDAIDKALYNFALNRVLEAPTVEPERKTGRWIPHDCLGSPSIDKDVCSCCGQRFYQIAETGCEWNFCPNCGARMEEPT